MAADVAGALGARVHEGLASFALEVRDVGRVDLEIDGAVENEPEHEAFGEDAGAAEHAPNRHHSKLRKQFADELGVQAGSLRVANAGIENTSIRPHEGTMGWRRRPAKHFIGVDRVIAAGATSGRPIPRTHKARGDSRRAMQDSLSKANRYRQCTAA